MAEIPVDLFGKLPTAADDWPADAAQQFWDRWPRHSRKHSFKQIVAKLAKIRKAREATWVAVFSGLEAYLNSEPEYKFIPAPMVWLNQQRWLADYSRREERGNKEVSFMDAALGRR